MKPLKCLSCISTLKKVKVPRKARKHIIKEHYHKKKEGRKSMFFKKSMSPQGLFDKVSDVLRSGIKASEKRGVRNIYYHTFAFKVGVFPNQHGGFSATKTVKIVCKITNCAKCGRRWPSKVVTIYPFKRPFI